MPRQENGASRRAKTDRTRRGLRVTTTWTWQCLWRCWQMPFPRRTREGLCWLGARLRAWTGLGSSWVLYSCTFW
eukprot:3722431-Pyramimonas_sp.AAC.1